MIPVSKEIFTKRHAPAFKNGIEDGRLFVNIHGELTDRTFTLCLLPLWHIPAGHGRNLFLFPPNPEWKQPGSSPGVHDQMGYINLSSPFGIAERTHK